VNGTKSILLLIFKDFILKSDLLSLNSYEMPMVNINMSDRWTQMYDQNMTKNGSLSRLQYKDRLENF